MWVSIYLNMFAYERDGATFLRLECSNNASSLLYFYTYLWLKWSVLFNIKRTTITANYISIQYKGRIEFFFSDVLYEIKKGNGGILSFNEHSARCTVSRGGISYAEVVGRCGYSSHTFIHSLELFMKKQRNITKNVHKNTASCIIF